MQLLAAAVVVAAAAASSMRSSSGGSGGRPARSPKTCAITDHGASTSAANNTAAIAAAIVACAKGGTVLVAGGAYKTGPLVVSGASNLELRVEAGASLEAAFGPDDWPVQDEASLADMLRDEERTKPVVNTTGHYQDFLVFDSCDGCALTGEGMLFGKGGRPPVGYDWYYLVDQGKLKHSRPMLLTVSSCKNFKMHGLTLLDAPMFNVALNDVHGAEISHVNITSRWYIDPKTKQLMEPHNTDGIDPGGGSSEIHIHDVYIHNGDDSVAVKPADSCTRNILVENCIFEDGHGCSIGAENACSSHVYPQNDRFAETGSGKL